MSVLLGLLLACHGSTPDTATILVDTAYRGFPRLLDATAECDPGGAVVVRARTVGWSSSGLVQVWDPAGGYAAFFTRTIAFTADETCDLVEGSSAAAEKTEAPSLATCTTESLSGFTFLVQVWYERGCAGVLAWGPEADAVYASTIAPSPVQFVEAGVVDEACSDVLATQTSATATAVVVAPPLRCE